MSGERSRTVKYDEGSHDEEDEVARKETTAHDGCALRARAGAEGREDSREVLGDKVAVG